MATGVHQTRTQTCGRLVGQHPYSLTSGIILHRMLFLLSPYKNPEDLSELHNEIIHYQGYRATPETLEACERRHIPKSLLLLLERLLHLSPEQRPSAERVKEAVEEFGRRASGRSWKPWGRAKAADPKRQVSHPFLSPADSSDQNDSRASCRL